VVSQLVNNLLLETARIALEEDLSVYIICTMLSDYIGQCASFRGLPEMIGFSQFFVPSLKRKEIYQVIEEPAILSGNKISNRLTETLINELGEGFDQLPVLQHALNQIWKQADNGNEEMDLLHLAKVNGLSPHNLPPEDKAKFNQWFECLPEFKKALFKNPSLENVLNVHANELYETAHEFVQKNSGEEISEKEAKNIIKTAFQCLTKIDDERAVRNRMTLQEITNIINRPEINTKTVENVLNIFRIQGNTLLKPFITHEPETLNLKPETVLDITHESLIRNWALLNEWAREEQENYLTWLDFSKQLKRWIDSGRKKGYLLPIGPLTFFENWYNDFKPNKYWLARYDDSKLTREEKLQKAEELLANAQEFIRRSAFNLFFSRTIIKYGAKRIVTALGILLLACSCTYYYFDYRRKQNASVISDIVKRGVELLMSNKVKPTPKAEFLINY
jgi:hypothetical protein